MTLGRALADLCYWPWTHARGFTQLWRDSGPALATFVTAANLARYRRNVWVRLHGFTIEIRTGTPDLMVALDSLGPEFDAVTGLPEPGGLIVDAGGYIGTAALRLATTFPKSRVMAVEPARDNRALLRRNVEDLPNVEIIGAALAPAEGEVSLSDPGAGEWGFSTVAGGRLIDTVPAVTVESLMARAGVDRIFLLKLDIEGAEKAVLESSGGWMDRTEIVIAELHEAIAPGTEAAFARATAGRTNTRLNGEKVMSIRA